MQGLLCREEVIAFEPRFFEPWVTGSPGPTQGNGFGYVLGSNGCTIVQVRQGPGHPEDARVGPCTEAKVIHAALQKPLAVRIERHKIMELLSVQSMIGHSFRIA